MTTMTSGKLAAWLAKARPGCCPCGTVLKRRLRGPGERVLCDKRRCRKKYDELYQQDRRGPTSLRAVKRREPIPDRPEHVRLVLECRHHADLARSLARRIKARCRCATCEAKDSQPQAPGDPPAAEQ